MKLGDDQPAFGAGRLAVIRSPLLASVPGLRHGFTTRLGGVSRGPFAELNLGHGLGDDEAGVSRNLRVVADDAGVDGFHLAAQMHGTRLLFVEKGACSADTAEERADALSTREVGVAVAVRTADCLPILLFDPKSATVAAVHAGWRGTVAGVVRAAVEAMVEKGAARPDRFMAAMGPCIGSCCFEVGEEVGARFTRSCPDAVQVRAGRVFVDLRRANEEALVDAGLRAERIERVGSCTYCNEDNYFSHRRDKGITGRHLSYIVRHPAGPEPL